MISIKKSPHIFGFLHILDTCGGICFGKSAKVRKALLGVKNLERLGNGVRFVVGVDSLRCSTKLCEVKWRSVNYPINEEGGSAF